MNPTDKSCNMSLFSSFKKALGFPDEYEDLDDLSDLEDSDTPEAGSDTELVEQEEIISDDPLRQEIPHTPDLQASEKVNALIDKLNARIQELEAEHEQLKLENKCMADKLRGDASPVIAASHAATSPADKEEIKRLQSELRHVKTRLSQSEQKVASLTDQMSKTDDSELTSLKSIIAGLRSDNTRMTDQLRQSESRIEEARKENEDLNARIEQLSIRLKTEADNHDRERDSLTAEIKRLSHLLQATDASTAPVPPVQEESSAAPTAKNRRKRNKGKRRYQDTVLPEMTEPTVKISAIDELMDNTDWFIPAEPGPRPKDPDTEENFGYREPTKKSTKNNTDKNQLTLF